MEFKFEELIKQYGLDENKFKATLKIEIAELRQAAEDPDSDEDEMAKGDAEICKMIEEYKKNIDGVKAMQKAKEAKKQREAAEKAAAEKAAAEKAAAEQTPPAQTPPAQTPPAQQDEPAPAGEGDGAVKKSSGFGTVLSIAAAVGLAIFGINYFKSRR